MTYRAYEPSGVPWLGEVPAHWEIRRLRTVAGMRVSNVDKHTKENEVSVRLCNYVDVYKNNRITQQLPFMTATASEDEVERFRLDQNDVIITKDSETWDDIGVPALVTEPAKDLISGYHLAILHPRADMYGPYLFWALQSRPAAYQFHIGSPEGLPGSASVALGGSPFSSGWLPPQSEAKGVTRYGLSHNGIQSVYLPLPPIDEQAAIVRFLDHAEEQIQRYIAAKERLIALLEEQRRVLVHQAVTRGLDPNVRLKPSGVEWLGKIPEDWEVARFAREVNIAEGQVDPKIEPYTSMLMIAPNHVESGTGRLLSRETASEQGAISGKYFCRAGDVVYSKIRPALAKVSVAPTDCLCSADMYPLRPRNSLQSGYLFWLLLSTGFTAWSVLQSDRVAMPKINRQTLNNMHIPLPLLSEQAAIVQHLIEATAKASSAIDRAHSQIDLMNEYRTRLIADVVTGQLDVRDTAAQLSETPLEDRLPTAI